MKTATKLISLVTCLCLLLCAFAVTAAAATPAANSTLTIPEANAIGEATTAPTTDKYYVAGTITEITNSNYGNMKIADDAGNVLTIYGSFNADGTIKYKNMDTKPVAGDKVKLYGVLSQYRGTAQMVDGWIVEHTPGTPVTPPPSSDPIADSTLTIAEAIALGTSKAHNNYTTGKYYVVGEITEVYGPDYGNLRITDDAGNILTIYGSYAADGTKYKEMTDKPDAGDTVKLYGIIGQYNGTPQMKNANIIEFTDGTPPVNNDPTPDTELTIAQALELGATKNHDSYTQGKYYVTGVITEVYNPQYGNMKIADAAGNILTIYGSYNADGTVRYDALEKKPVAGDTVKVYGIIGQYNDTVQLKNGWIVAHTSTGGEAPKAPEDPKEIVKQAYELEAGKTLPYTVTLTGKIVSVDTPYSDDYKNITISIAVEGCEDKPIQCFRLKGDGANALAAGDTVTVTGVVTNHEGKIQFSSGCKLDKVVAGTRVPATGDVSILLPAAAMLVSGMGTVALIIKKKEF